jgi:hypothetical protein
MRQIGSGTPNGVPIPQNDQAMVSFDRALAAEMKKMD